MPESLPGTLNKPSTNTPLETLSARPHIFSSGYSLPETYCLLRVPLRHVAATKKPGARTTENTLHTATRTLLRLPLLSECPLRSLWKPLKTLPEKALWHAGDSQLVFGKNVGNAQGNCLGVFHKHVGVALSPHHPLPSSPPLPSPRLPRILLQQSQMSPKHFSSSFTAGTSLPYSPLMELKHFPDCTLLLRSINTDRMQQHITADFDLIPAFL